MTTKIKTSKINHHLNFWYLFEITITSKKQTKIKYEKKFKIN